jgi:hypothetical protein
MPAIHERDERYVHKEIFDFFVNGATKLLDKHEKDSIDFQRRIMDLEAARNAAKTRYAFWGSISGAIFSTAVIEGIKYLTHR